jgi:(p)ppGpp synthase/HD superfamily hydrolase
MKYLSDQSPIISKARAFAISAHGGIRQQRKYTDEPYIVHPRAVARMVEGYGASDHAIAAAWLHDVVEDTPARHQTIFEQFGEEVAKLVFFVTDVSVAQDGNRHIRKALDRFFVASGPSESKLIKLCDLMDNTKTIVRYDPTFAAVYIPEKEAIVNEIAKAGYDDLLLKPLSDARDMIERAKAELSARKKMGV